MAGNPLEHPDGDRARHARIVPERLDDAGQLHLRLAVDLAVGRVADLHDVAGALQRHPDGPEQAPAPTVQVDEAEVQPGRRLDGDRSRQGPRHRCTRVTSGTARRLGAHHRPPALPARRSMYDRMRSRASRSRGPPVFSTSASSLPISARISGSGRNRSREARMLASTTACMARQRPTKGRRVPSPTTRVITSAREVLAAAGGTAISRTWTSRQWQAPRRTTPRARGAGSHPRPPRAEAPFADTQPSTGPLTPA